MKLYDKPCRECGRMMYQVAKNRVLCYDCAMVIDQIRKQRKAAEHSKMPLINKPCMVCREIQRGATVRKLRWPKCKDRRAKLRSQTGIKYKAELTKLFRSQARPGHAPPQERLNECALKAEQEGLSYGYYVLKHGLY